MDGFFYLGVWFRLLGVWFFSDSFGYKICMSWLGMSFAFWFLFVFGYEALLTTLYGFIALCT